MENHTKGMDNPVTATDRNAIKAQLNTKLEDGVAEKSRVELKDYLPNGLISPVTSVRTG